MAVNKKFTIQSGAEEHLVFNSNSCVCSHTRRRIFVLRRGFSRRRDFLAFFFVSSLLLSRDIYDVGKASFTIFHLFLEAFLLAQLCPSGSSGSVGFPNNVEEVLRLAAPEAADDDCLSAFRAVKSWNWCQQVFPAPNWNMHVYNRNDKCTRRLKSWNYRHLPIIGSCPVSLHSTGPVITYTFRWTALA